MHPLLWFVVDATACRQPLPWQECLGQEVRSACMRWHRVLVPGLNATSLVMGGQCF